MVSSDRTSVIGVGWSAPPESQPGICEESIQTLIYLYLGTKKDNGTNSGPAETLRPGPGATCARSASVDRELPEREPVRGAPGLAVHPHEPGGPGGEADVVRPAVTRAGREGIDP